MKSRLLHLLSWFAGMLGVTLVVWLFQVDDLSEQLRKVGVYGAIGWLVLTLIARMMVVEATVVPIRVLGFSLLRKDAFWISWIRTFANQVVPLSGSALFANEIRRKTGIAWADVSALSAPVYFIPTASLAAIGVLAVVSNIESLGHAATPSIVVFSVVMTVFMFAATRAAWVIDHLPFGPFIFAKDAAVAFRNLSENRLLVAKLLGLHFVAILVRGTRIWLLFIMVGVNFSWHEALLLIVIGEAATLIQITPGGLGLREGAIVGAAVLLDVSAELSATVALIDRLFAVGITTFLAIPGFLYLRLGEINK